MHVEETRDLFECRPHFAELAEHLPARKLEFIIIHIHHWIIERDFAWLAATAPFLGDCAFDLAKGLKDIDDATRRNAAVIELQEKILAAHRAQLELAERARELEKQLASFEQWDTEKEKYELKEIYPETFAYVLKETARGTEPSHSICAACYQMRKKSILQKFRRGAYDLSRM